MLGPVESISLEQMKMVFETNFFGAVRMIKEVMPDMKRRRAGHIIVMSSVMGMQGNVGDVQNISVSNRDGTISPFLFGYWYRNKEYRRPFDHHELKMILKEKLLKIYEKNTLPFKSLESFWGSPTPFSLLA